MMTSKFLIPAQYIQDFKSIAKKSSRYIQENNGPRIRGRILLDLFARAAGYDSYSHLINESKQFNNKPEPDWYLLCEYISGPLSNELENLDRNTIYKLLLDALLDIEIIDGVLHKYEWRPSKKVSPTIRRPFIQTCSYKNCSHSDELIPVVSEMGDILKLCREHIGITAYELSPIPHNLIREIRPCQECGDLAILRRGLCIEHFLDLDDEIQDLNRLEEGEALDRLASENDFSWS